MSALPYGAIEAWRLSRMYGLPLLIQSDAAPGASTITVNAPRHVRSHAWSWLVEQNGVVVTSVAIGGIEQLNVRVDEQSPGVWSSTWAPGQQDLGYELGISIFGDSAGPLVLKVVNPHEVSVKVLIRLWRSELKPVGEEMSPREMAQLTEYLQDVCAVVAPEVMLDTDRRLRNLPN